MTITLLGEPKSTSHIYHYHCKFGRPSGYMTAEGKALKEDYQWQAKSQWRGDPHAGPLCVSVTLFFGTRRKADIDNFNKLVLDALTGVVWGDDGQINKLRVVRAYDRQRPRVEVRITTDEVQGTQKSLQ